MRQTLEIHHCGPVCDVSKRGLYELQKIWKLLSLVLVTTHDLLMDVEINKGSAS